MNKTSARDYYYKPKELLEQLVSIILTNILRPFYSNSSEEGLWIISFSFKLREILSKIEEIFQDFSIFSLII